MPAGHRYVKLSLDGSNHAILMAGVVLGKDPCQPSSDDVASLDEIVG